MSNPLVMQALADAWRDSRPNSPDERHEEGGWVYMDVVSGTIQIERAYRGTKRRIDLSNPPPKILHVVVAKFHTHPNPEIEGFDPEPSDQDRIADARHGVPDLIVSEKKVYISGPDSRRGGLSGSPGFPN
jgi:hypothetical protein